MHTAIPEATATMLMPGAASASSKLRLGVKIVILLASVTKLKRVPFQKQSEAQPQTLPKLLS